MLTAGHVDGSDRRHSETSHDVAATFRVSVHASVNDSSLAFAARLPRRAFGSGSIGPRARAFTQINFGDWSKGCTDRAVDVGTSIAPSMPGSAWSSTDRAFAAGERALCLTRGAQHRLVATSLAAAEQRPLDLAGRIELGRVSAACNDLAIECRLRDTTTDGRTQHRSYRLGAASSSVR